MKLRNRQTGEIKELPDGFFCGDSLKKICEEWEDYHEEPKEYWFIRDDGSGVGYSPIGNSTVAKRREEIGNCFSSQEEAELAVRKLKAWKRLKDKGFRFDGYNACSVDYDIDEQYRRYISKDLDLLFSEAKNETSI